MDRLILTFRMLCAVFFVSAGNENNAKATEAIVTKPSIGDRRQYRDGDIIIGAAIPVTRRDSRGVCRPEFTEFGIQFVETMNMVVDQINNDDNILPGVILGTVMINTCSSDAHALQRVILDILPLALDADDCTTNCTGKRKPILSGVVGAVASSVSMPITKVLQVFSISQISYWSTNPDLSNKMRFKYFFRTVPPDTYQARAIISLVKQRMWNYISVVYDDDAYGVSGYTELVKSAGESDVCIAIELALPTNPYLEDMTHIIEELMTSEKSKVVVVFTSTTNAEKLISSAQKVPGADSLIWVGSDGWAAYLPRDFNDEPYLESLDGSVGFIPKFGRLANVEQYVYTVTLAQNQGENFSRNPWFEDYITQQNNCTVSDDDSIGLRKCKPDERIDPETFVYLNNSIGEAVLAFVHALDAYHKDKCHNQSGLCEAISSKAGTNQVACDIHEYLKNVSFRDGNGRMFKFDENQDGPPIYDVFMFSKALARSRRRNDWIHAGVYDEHGVDLYTDLLQYKLLTTVSNCSAQCGIGQARIVGTETCCWHCENCNPREYVARNGSSCLRCAADETPLTNRSGCKPLPIRHMEYDSAYVIFPLALGGFGLICTLFVTIVFILYRETAMVRASGKELCFFVLFGVFFTLMNCFTVTTPPSLLSCTLSGIILAMGPTCMYAGLLMKTVRVVFIFQSRGIMTSRTKVYLQPTPLILITTAVTFLQIIVLSIWFVVDSPPKEKKIITTDFVFSTCENLVEIEILVGLVYPFLIIIVCTVLATVNRNVPTGFKETLYVGFTSYTTCAIWLAFLPIFLTNSTDIPKKITTVSVALSLSALTVLFCLFGPRCYTILFDPESNTSETVMSIKRPRHDSAWSIGIPTSMGNETMKSSASTNDSKRKGGNEKRVFDKAVGQSDESNGKIKRRSGRESMKS